MLNQNSKNNLEKLFNLLVLLNSLHYTIKLNSIHIPYIIYSPFWFIKYLMLANYGNNG